MDLANITAPQTEEDWTTLRMVLDMVPEDVRRAMPDEVGLLQAMLDAHDKEPG